VTLGPGDVVAGRYELIRMLGGGDGGRVYVAYDRHLSREVVLRLVEAGDRAVAAALLEEGRRMASVQAELPQAVSVLDAGEIDGGGAYTATELVDGTPLDELARRRAPLPAGEAKRYAVQLLEACLAVQRHEQGRAETVVASALATADGQVRVTRFAHEAPAAGGADPAVGAVARTLRDLLAGGPAPPALRETIDDALAGRIRTADELRARLLADTEIDHETVVMPASPEEAPRRGRWPWIVAAVVAVVAVVAIAVIWIVVEDRAEQVTVPDVAGLTAAEAVSALRDAGFATTTDGQVSATVDKGLVIGTSPAAGESADEGSTVTIDVSQGTGTVSVPALVGLSQAQATEALTSAGLESRVVDAPSATVDEGDVIGQDPAAGLQIDVGSTVALTVSTGPAPVTVPDVTGQTLAQATLALQQAGLVVGSVQQRDDASVPAGEVIGQSPGAGGDVTPGSDVDLTVSRSPATTSP
jgi:beta-lactam-binding protein with PASTA domain